MKDRKFEEVTLRTEEIYKGRVISLQVDHVRLPNGETATREIVKHPGAVGILALHEGRMIVVEQYRKALGKNQVEIPAGKLDAGEDPLEAARRELEEETGFHCGKLEHVSSFYTSPGFADEILHLYWAGDLQKGEMNLDEDEFLDCFEITLDQAKALIGEGRISDAKTIAAVYAWQLYELTGRFA
ncbi:NUDIX domain-containing protein [Ferviditalea candida]|uniref:NUDIX hydrolase n=1 Tax=Ferviditalea candida TaxID=3108399 RepID=A0ABU5ZJQ6_9BACL|nr:NUDIX hydrolase [Paenibacillaceae bacterium T2]